MYAFMNGSHTKENIPERIKNKINKKDDKGILERQKT
jgi:hypothetical protein